VLRNVLQGGWPIQKVKRDADTSNTSFTRNQENSPEGKEGDPWQVSCKGSEVQSRAGACISGKEGGRLGPSDLRFRRGGKLLGKKGKKREYHYLA